MSFALGCSRITNDIVGGWSFDIKKLPTVGWYAWSSYRVPGECHSVSVKS
jgi:hypothetical protein